MIEAVRRFAVLGYSRWENKFAMYDDKPGTLLRTVSIYWL